MSLLQKNIWIQNEVIVQAKRSTKLRSPTGVTAALVKRNKDTSEENAPRGTGYEHLNRFSRISLKFPVSVTMLVDIHIALLLVELIFHGGQCVSLAPYAKDYSVWVYSCWNCFPFIRYITNNHFPWFSSTAVIFVLACKQRFLSCMHHWLLVFTKSFVLLLSCVFGLLTTQLTSEADFVNTKTSKSQAGEKKLLMGYLRTVLV